MSKVVQPVDPDQAAAGEIVSIAPQVFSGDDIIAAIRQAMGQMRRAEQRVAEVVLADVEFAVHASSGDLARRAGVSEPSVTRFSRAAGCSGVRELKVKLAQSLVVGRIYLEPPPHLGSDLARPALWRSVFGEIRKAISAAEDQLDVAVVETAAAAIAKAARVMAFGVGGGSTLLATEVEHRFFRLGLAVAHTSDPQLMRMMAATLGKGDVVIALSTAGKAVDVIDAARIARSHGATIVAITKPLSALARAADLALCVQVAEFPDALKPTASRFALLAAVDLLAAATAYARPTAAQESMRRIKLELVKATGGQADEPLGD